LAGLPIAVAFAHVISADLNNDGLLDLAGVGGGQFGDTLVVAFGNGDGTFQPAIETLVPMGGQFLVPGDFNRDGNLDLGLGITGEATTVVPKPHSIRLYYGNGNGTFTFSADARLAVGGSGPGGMVLRFAGLAAKDLDGDGNLDIVAADPFNRALHVFRGRADGTFPRDPNTGQMIVVTTPLPAGAKFLATPTITATAGWMPL
jgi:hypothetical protein